MSKPLVSVIIPIYNAEKYIDECIESITNQTYTNIEVIVCDDCSTDGSRKKIQKYEEDKRFIFLKNDTNLHQAATRNKCIEASKGNFILLQDADDISEPDRIQKLLNAFEDDVDFVGSACYCFNDIEGRFESWIKGKKYPSAKDFLKGMPFVHASLLFKRECLLKVNGYRLTKHTDRGEDYDLLMRLYATGFKGKNIPDLLYGYRVNKETIERRSFKARIDECFIRYDGFKENNILFPLGVVCVFKPILAHIYQQFKYKKRF